MTSHRQGPEQKFLSAPGHNRQTDTTPTAQSKLKVVRLLRNRPTRPRARRAIKNTLRFLEINKEKRRSGSSKRTSAMKVDSGLKASRVLVNTHKQDTSKSLQHARFLLKCFLGWGQLCFKSDLLPILKINVSFKKKCTNKTTTNS